MSASGKRLAEVAAKRLVDRREMVHGPLAADGTTASTMSRPQLIMAGILAASTAAQGLPCVAAVGSGRVEVGTRDVAGIALGVASAGVELCPTATTRLRAAALFLEASGTSPDGRRAHAGAGGELALHVLPLPDWPVRPYALASAGALLFPRAPFLPGGDFYDFILNFGAGLEITLGANALLGANVHYAHLSNGQGLGPFNPAFSGWGAGLDIGWRWSASPPPTRPWTGGGPEAARDSWTPGIVLDTGVGHAEALLLAERVRIAERLAPGLLVLLDTDADTLASVALVEAGVSIVRHWRIASAGIHAGYRNYAGLKTTLLDGQVEAHTSEEISFLAVGSWEHADLAGDSFRSGLGLRAFPVRSLVLDLGVGLDPRRAASRDAYAAWFGVEWQAPVGGPDWQLSSFAELDLDSKKLVGLRVAWGMGRTLEDQARQMGWRRIR